MQDLVLPEKRRSDSSILSPTTRSPSFDLHERVQDVFSPILVSDPDYVLVAVVRRAVSHADRTI
jgi:hypothetical protein